MFREIFGIAVDTFEDNKKDYHVDLALKDIFKDIEDTGDEELRNLVYDKNIRRMLHISYGAILERKKNELFKVLFDNEEKHYDFIENHLKKHFDALNFQGSG